MLSSQSEGILEDGTNGPILGSQNPLMEDVNIQGSLALANELLEEVKRNMITHALESAILLLREVLDEDDQHADTQDVARRYLIMALGTRFAIHGWVEDFDECFALGVKISPQAWVQLGSKRKQLIKQDIFQDNESLRLVVDLIKECRRSIDIQKLDTAICIAEEALMECGQGELMNQVKFHLHLGSALVMRSLFYESTESLSAASGYFRNVGGLCEAGPSRYACFIALAHIGLLKATEGRDFGGLKEMLSNIESAEEEDREGRESLNIGAQLLEENKLHEAVQFLSMSLHHRSFPHPRRAVSLGSLASALCAQFQQMGDISDLEESILLHRDSLLSMPTPHPLRGASLNNLAGAIQARFQQKGDIQDLEQAILLHREVLSLIPPRHPLCSISLNNLATSLWTRFERNGDIQDLEEAIGLGRDSLLLRPPSHPLRSMSLNNLASSVRTRFEQKGDIQDLEEAILLQREALLLMAPPHPFRSMSLNNLAGAVCTRFQEKGDIQDLEEAILLHRESLSLRPSPHPNRSTSLDNLAGAVCTRFEEKGDNQDLEEAILLHRDSLLLRPPPHPLRSVSLNNLAAAICTQFEQKGDIQDLEEAILLQREALLLRPPPHPLRAMSLNNLATSVRTRFKQKGDPQDLEEAILLHRESLQLKPSSHPLRSASLNNLAAAIYTQFEQKGDVDDLEEAILVHRESLLLKPPPHPLRYTSLDNLASSIRTRFELKGDIQDLEEAILLHQESLRLKPPPHPLRSVSLNNLANTLRTRFGISGSSNDLNNAFHYYAAASHYNTGPLFDRLGISKFWAHHARRHSHSSVLDAYQCAVAILPRLASLDLSLRQRQSVLTHAGQITSDAAQCAIDQNSLDTAIVFLATGRLVFWSQSLHLRTPMDHLAEKEPELAEQIRSASRRLENAAYAPRDGDRTPDVSTPDLTRLSHLVDVRDEALEKARQIEGFEDFLLPPSLKSIQKAARHGPIVILNASQYGCDALILRHAEVPVERVHLVEMDLALLMVLKDIVQRLSWGDDIEARAIEKVEYKMKHFTAATSASGIEYQSEAFLDAGDSESMQRHQGVGFLQRRITNQSAFRFVLGLLWTTIVEPVLETLKQEKTTLPRRLWWCPTSLFAFLPIHAAGLYSEDETRDDCLSNYVISSYCSSPQDLIVTEEGEVSSPFKFFAVIESDAIDGNISLPCTLTELEKIKQHLPSQEDLIPYESSNKSPTPLNAVLTNIQKSTCVHFGCHGHQHLTDPLESSLILSGGKLTMERIIRDCQSSGASLAYLSACETAKGDEARPDESLNLVATMMFAGFKSVVGTMWSIQDRDGPIVADKFYSHLFRHKQERAPNIRDAAEGLHLAVKELRLRRRPFRDWVPFVHYGI